MGTLFPARADNDEDLRHDGVKWEQFTLHVAEVLGLTLNVVCGIFSMPAMTSSPYEAREKVQIILHPGSPGFCIEVAKETVNL